jgi:nucleoside-diphosphate-sugar epimerase
VLAAHERGDLETAVIRPCRFYGPGLATRVRRVFELIRSGRIPIFGDGLALRSMSSVDDVARVLVQCLDDLRAAGETFWIADERPHTTLEVFLAMAAAAEVPLQTLRLPEAVARSCEVLALAYERLGGYPMSLHLAGESYRNIGCSIEKAKRVLAFEPRNDLVGGFREGLEEVGPAVPLVAA